jgi:hypothetical protein
MEIQTQPVSLTYCSNLNCIILSRTDNSIDIIDVNSGYIVRESFVLGKVFSRGLAFLVTFIRIYVLFYSLYKVVIPHRLKSCFEQEWST